MQNKRECCCLGTIYIETKVDPNRPVEGPKGKEIYHCKPIEFNYIFHKDQLLNFMVNDAEGEFIGEMYIKLGNIMIGKQMKKKEIKNTGDVTGELIVRCEKFVQTNDIVKFDCVCKNLVSKKFLYFCSVDKPFFRIERSNTPDSEEYTKIHESHYVTRRNPRWNRQKFLALELTHEEIDNKLKFTILSHNSSGKHTPYGYFVTTLYEIEKERQVFHLRDVKTDEEIPEAKFIFEKFQYIERPCFYDFLSSQYSINLTVAIDFTISNLDPRREDSLHYINSDGTLNQYQSVMQTVGRILEAYDDDKKIPAYGFGALIPRKPTPDDDSPYEKETSHCFTLNGEEIADCEGIEGLLEAYKNTVERVKFFGETCFEPCIRTCVDKINNSVVIGEDEKGDPYTEYTILLIITDGQINDMKATKDLIVESSKLPLSIIIIGVGDEDFEHMIELDSDDTLLRDSNNHFAFRDIVQFVKYQDFEEKGMHAISEEVLKEVPDQVISYLGINNIDLGKK
ncbi:unnamed protein product [Moneuplotes crassus]|uniref:VWFA domain-containing protein n=1 Tax=Euplotes crassus TaxID=5936 RepID=A0AAD1YAJ7_EUPCR|nr:unnamed protein product [Moneuplotes crassus]